jgi:hypothetical protein
MTPFHLTSAPSHTFSPACAAQNNILIISVYSFEATNNSRGNGSCFIPLKMEKLVNTTANSRYMWWAARMEFGMRLFTAGLVHLQGTILQSDYSQHKGDIRNKDLGLPF